MDMSVKERKETTNQPTQSRRVELPRFYNRLVIVRSSFLPELRTEKKIFED